MLMLVKITNIKDRFRNLWKKLFTPTEFKELLPAHNYRSRVEILAALIPLLRKNGILWADLCKRCDQIIAIGSFACNTNTTKSDIDIVCITGDETLKRIKNEKFEIIPEPLRIKDDPIQLSRELITHTARHGVWLYGKDDWSSKSKVTEVTISRKINYLIKYQKTVSAYHQLLSHDYLKKHIKRLRRNCWRLVFYINNETCPTGAYLDTLSLKSLDKLWKKYKLEQKGVSLRLLKKYPEL